MHALLPFLLFAFVASITPGPTNLLVLGTAARHGLLAALPLVLGACLGAAGLVLAVGMGIGELLQRHPLAQQGLAWLGVLWLSHLAWQILRSPATPIDPQAATSPASIGLLGGAALQLVNPKSWMMALAVVGVFAGNQPEGVALLALLFFLVSLPCLGTWACLGAGSARFLHSARRVRRFNQCMALLLLASAWLSLLG
ncbi:homoserine/Threonine efflux protein [compost metagenome]